MKSYHIVGQALDFLSKQFDNKVSIEKARSPQSSHEEAWKWLDKEGLSDGTNPQGYLTREQFASLLHRYHQKFVAK